MAEAQLALCTATLTADQTQFNLEYSIPNNTCSTDYWRAFDVRWKRFEHNTPLAELDAYATEVQRELHDMERDLLEAIEVAREELAHLDTDTSNEGSSSHEASAAELRQCLSRLLPALRVQSVVGGDDWHSRGALVHALPPNQHDGAWLARTWVSASTGRPIVSQGAACTMRRWIMYMGDDQARGMYDASVERLLADRHYRLDEIGESAGVLSDRDALLIDRRSERQVAAGNATAFRAVYLSYRRVNAFSDVEKLAKSLETPKNVYRWQRSNG